MSADDSTNLARAEGFLELGMPDEAWNALDDLPSASQILLPVLLLRVRILIAAKSWMKAEILAESLLSSMPSKGELWYALAQAQAQLGKVMDAKTTLQRACEADERLKVKALQDPLLGELW